MIRSASARSGMFGQVWGTLALAGAWTTARLVQSRPPLRDTIMSPAEEKRPGRFLALL